MTGILESIRPRWTVCFLLVLAACAPGCTSAISTAYLREALWELGDHAAEPNPAAATVQASEGKDATAEPAAVPESTASDQERREAAIAEAVSRLARIGPLPRAARETLIETLRRTAQEDWPVVVEAFATTLESTAGVPDPAGGQPITDHAAADRHVVAKADLDAGTASEVGSPDSATAGLPPTPAEPTVPQPPVETATRDAEPPAVNRGQDPGTNPALAVANACFATRVRAWGAVDRFAQDAFRPGQEVIVYFELENLSAGESGAGHTTCIDTSLALVDEAGGVVEEWSFEPVAETCRTRRRDYFARYVVRLPGQIQAGKYHVEIAVIDTLAGSTARATLPLQVVPAATTDR